MAVILYQTLSLDGFIARGDGSVDYTLKGTWKSYFDFCKSVKVLVIGKNTYDIMPSTEFVKGCLYVILTHNVPKHPKIKNSLFTDKSPKEIIAMLRKKGYKHIGIGGGSKINSLFLNENLIDELIIDVEPVILGSGIKLFDKVSEKKFELIKTTKLSKQEMQLHYRVLK